VQDVRELMLQVVLQTLQELVKLQKKPEKKKSQ